MSQDNPKHKKRARRSKDSKPEHKSSPRAKGAPEQKPAEPDQKPAEPPEPMPSLTDPHRLAEIFLRQNTLERPEENLLFWRNECWAWDGRRYARLAPADLRARLTRSIRQTFDRDRARIAAQEEEEQKSKFKGARDAWPCLGRPAGPPEPATPPVIA